MSNVVIAGGAGFIGSHLVDRCLQAGDYVTVIDNLSTGSRKNLHAAENDYPDTIRFYEMDICTPEAARLIESIKPDVLHILAAQMSVKVSMKDPLEDARINIVGLVNLLEAARAANVGKVVFATSGGTIYGDHGDNLPIKEQAVPRMPSSFYGLTKSAAVDYLRIYEQAFGLKSVALALGNVYGPRQSPDGEAGVIAIFAKKLLERQTCVIHGDGKTTRDYVHVSDVIEAFYLAASRGDGLINIGTETETDVNTIYHLLEEKTGVHQDVTYDAALAGEIRRVALDTTRAKQELNWQPTVVQLSDGIDTVLSWLDSQQNSTDMV